MMLGTPLVGARAHSLTSLIIKKAFSVSVSLRSPLPHLQNSFTGLVSSRSFSASSKSSSLSKGSLPPFVPKNVASLIPGVATSAVVWTVGSAIANGLQPLPITGVPLALGLGFACRNLVPKHVRKFAPSTDALEPGLAFVKSWILPVGIACVGTKLSLKDVTGSGAAGLPVVAAAMGVGLVCVPQLGRALRIPPRLAALVAVGTSVCGVTAVMALSPAIAATEAEVALAVANVVLWGTIGMLAYPPLVRAIFGTEDEEKASKRCGIVLGLGIHDTAQVMGAALAYKQAYGDETAMNTAVVTKMCRNAMLAGALPFLVLTTKGAATSGRGGISISKAVPPFVWAFLSLSALRSASDAMGGPGGLLTWLGGTVAPNFLGISMAGLGLSTSMKVVRSANPTSLLLGGIGAALVGGTALVGASVAV